GESAETILFAAYPDEPAQAVGETAVRLVLRLVTLGSRERRVLAVQRGGGYVVLPLAALVGEIHLGVGGLRIGVAVGEQHTELGLAGPLRLRGGSREHGGDEENPLESAIHDQVLGIRVVRAEHSSGRSTRQ